MIAYTRHDESEHVVTIGRLELVEVIEHENERSGTGPLSCRQAGCRPRQDRVAWTADVKSQIRVRSRDPTVGRYQQGGQPRRIVVEAIKRHEGHGTLFVLSPLSEKRGLAIARRFRDTHDATTAALGLLDQMSPTDQALANLGC